MTQGERVKEVRKSLNLTMEQFGNKLGVTKVAISNIEKEKRNLTEQMSRAICREFNVSEEWLKTGEGEMYQQLSEDEEIAGIVSDLLEEGKDNAFYGIILEIAKTYNELSPASQKVLTEAAEKLAADGIDAKVINIHTIKPLDEELVVAAAKETGKVVTVEEHSIIGGLGGAVCECLAEKAPVPVKRIGINDVYGESGPAVALLEKYGLDADGIYKQIKEFA